jgi:CheY-like chemotaxis protein
LSFFFFHHIFLGSFFATFPFCHQTVKYKSPHLNHALRPDLIILDFAHQGGTTEWQLLQMLKMYESTASIPIVLCVTALRIFQEDYFRKKNIVLLYKPFEKNDLLEAVHQAFQLPR